MSNFFNRDTKMYIDDGTAIWEIPILEDYDFTQDTAVTEVELNEMASAAGVSRRGKRAFTDAFSPAEFSFSTYIRPFISGAGGGVGDADDTANHHAVEEALWAKFVGVGTYAAYAFTNMTTDTTSLDFDMAGSNRVTLGTFDLYFVLGATTSPTANYTAGSTVEIYKISDCVLDEVTIDFDVDGLAQTSWSGMGKLLTDEATFDASAAITEGIASTSNYIRNKLTGLALTADDATAYPGAGGGTYNLVLTGGSITMSNNITFLTPETLGSINVPFDHITGTKEVSGNFSCYLDTGTNGDVGDLLTDLAADKSTITNSFETRFIVGGAGNSPRVEITLPTAHLKVPTHSIDDIISLDIEFMGIPSTISTPDEATIKYIGA